MTRYIFEYAGKKYNISSANIMRAKAIFIRVLQQKNRVKVYTHYEPINKTILVSADNLWAKTIVTLEQISPKEFNVIVKKKERMYDIWKQKQSLYKDNGT